MNAVSVRGDWVGQVVDGRYPLLEWLGGSGTSGTFLTELDGLASHRAAIKLLPSSLPDSESRLAGWPAAAALSHPHLAQIHHYGRAEVDSTSCVYVVCDLAEELLSQIIPERQLTPDEARQMLDPILDTLDYLHNAGFAHGHLTPSNVLVVENEIKLSSDYLLSIEAPVPNPLGNDIHIAPELASGSISPRADIWSLGITLVEALTQQLPIWDAASDAQPVLPASIPAPFAEITRRCLHTDPARRCTVAEIRALLNVPSKPAASKPSPAPSLAPRQQRIPDKPLPARMPFLPLVIGLVLLAAIIIGFWLHSRNSSTAPLQTETTRQTPAAKSAQPTPQTTTPPAPEAVAPVSDSSPSSRGDVLNRDVPEVPQSARNTIHGTVSVVVRVSVDSSGAVTSAEYATHGPSAYFARIALESAHNWKFKPPQQSGRAVSNSWLLHYKFRRSGVDVTPNQTGR